MINFLKQLQVAATEPAQCHFRRRFSKRGTTTHHLISRTCQRNKWFQKRYTRTEMAMAISLCRQCHTAVHQFFPREKDLGGYYNTPEALMAHEKIGPFVRWASKQN